MASQTYATLLRFRRGATFRVAPNMEYIKIVQYQPCLSQSDPCHGEVLEFHDLCYLAVNTIAGTPGPEGATVMAQLTVITGIN